MSQARGAPLAAWLGYWGVMRRYHRYEVTGLSNLDLGRAALLVGYHGRPIAHDLCMLTVAINERLGYMPHAVSHAAADQQPVLKWVVDSLGFVTGDGEAIARVVARGEHIIVTPGGTREGCRSFRQRYQVDWDERTGYLRLALKYGLPILPIAASGVDDAYCGLNDGYALGKRLGSPYRLPIWLGLGPGGIWPLSLPFPVKIRQIIGQPIDLRSEGLLDPNDHQRISAMHHKVIGAVQGLLERARGSA